MIIFHSLSSINIKLVYSSALRKRFNSSLIRFYSSSSSSKIAIVQSSQQQLVKENLNMPLQLENQNHVHESRNYQSAISDLNSLQSNASTIQDLRTSGKAMNLMSIPEMELYMKRLGYRKDGHQQLKTFPELDQLNIIHVAGTKGKGSTCAFCDSILKRIPVQCKDGTVRNLKTGLFTSPHLMEARERIRIDGKPIEKEMFTRYFYQVWDKLQENESITEKGLDSIRVRPAYFRFLTLLAFHVFIQEKVDVVILEVGIGGEYDSTNVVPSPLITCITSLGYDHVNLLGEKIESIAWHKSGIFKKDSIALSVDQVPSAMKVIRDRAIERNVLSFEVVHPSDSFDHKYPNIQLGLKGEYQKINAALAIAAVSKWVSVTSSRDDWKINTDNLDSLILEGLEKASWPGRCQIYQDVSNPGTIFYLDGAHTQESMELCVHWFKSEIEENLEESESHHRFLIFNLTRGRSPSKLLRYLIHFQEEYPFDRVVFCTNQPFRKDHSNKDVCDFIDYNETHNSELQEQRTLQSEWISQVEKTRSNRIKNTQVYVVESVEEAIELVNEGKHGKKSVLVTGSLHLIGATLKVLNAPVS